MPISLKFARKRALIALTAALASAVLTGCASAPMQEMSDARQAIRAAQDAGAANTAAQPLSEAQIALNRAESQLNKRFFRAARRSAEEAHGKAVEALQLARETKH
jgi:hypothetical protein